MSFNSGGTTLSAQFNLKSQQPIDGRYIITTKEEYQEMRSIALYPGLSFTVTQTLELDDGSIITEGFYKVGIDGVTITKQGIVVSIETLTDEDDGEYHIACYSASEIFNYANAGSIVMLEHEGLLYKLESCGYPEKDATDKVANFTCINAEDNKIKQINVYEDKSIDIFDKGFIDLQNITERFISYTEDQELTATQKTKAKNNLGIKNLVFQIEEDATSISIADLQLICASVRTGSTVLLNNHSKDRYYPLLWFNGGALFFGSIKRDGRSLEGYHIFTNGKVQYVNSHLGASLIVGAPYNNEHKASHTATDIYNHIAAGGGTVLLHYNDETFAVLTAWSSTTAVFSFIADDQGIVEKIVIDSEGNIEELYEAYLTTMSPVLRYNEAQSLSTEEKAQAKENLGILSTLIVRPESELIDGEPTGRMISDYTASEIYAHIQNGGFAVLDVTDNLESRRFVFSTAQTDEFGLNLTVSFVFIDTNKNTVEQLWIDGNGVITTGMIDIQSGCVLYDNSQNLSDEQQLQARDNIGATGIQIITWDDDD